MTFFFQRNKGVGYALISALLFAFCNLTIRFASEFATVWHMVLTRCFLGLVVTLVAAKIFSIDLRGKNRAGMTLIGLANVVSVISLVGALTLLPLFQALVLFYLYPACSALFSPFLVKDRFSPAAWILIGLACLGTVLILWPEEKAPTTLQWGHLLGLTAAFSQGLTLTLIRRFSNDHHPMTPFFYFCLIGVLASALPLVSIDAPLSVAPVGWLLMMLMATLTMAAQLALYRALAFISSPAAGTIGTSEVVWGGLFGWFIFHEPLTWLSLFGSALILGGGIGLNLLSFFKTKKQD